MRNRSDLFPVVVGFLLMIAAILFLGSCSGVILDAEYSALLDRTVALSDETTARSDANLLTMDEHKAVQRKYNVAWHRFQNARNGVADDANGVPK